MTTLFGLFHSTSICPADSPGPFLFTPNSLLLENTLITDLQQITGNGQKSITCAGVQQGRIFRQESTDQVVGEESISQQHLHTNGHYYCLGHSMKRIYFNIFTNNFSESITHVGDAKVYTCPKSEAYTPFHSCPTYTNHTHQCWRVDLHITRWQPSGEIYCRI